jgi:hypothetical protein
MLRLSDEANPRSLIGRVVRYRRVGGVYVRRDHVPEAM